jgi:hypothetical protein
MHDEEYLRTSAVSQKEEKGGKGEGGYKEVLGSFRMLYRLAVFFTVFTTLPVFRLAGQRKFVFVTVNEAGRHFATSVDERELLASRVWSFTFWGKSFQYSFSWSLCGRSAPPGNRNQFSGRPTQSNRNE